jgi:hypothetical protein
MKPDPDQYLSWENIGISLAILSNIQPMHKDYH